MSSQYFVGGTTSEQNLHEDLIVECLDFWGVDFYYIPRTIVYRDQIFTEDRLSEFKDKYLIRGYFDQIEAFGGQGAFIQKFGLQMEQSATIVIARRVWDQTIGAYGQTQLPNRPSEGDLLYWPLNGGLFEIKFVDYQNPFYQLGKLYVYRLDIELFQYASERINTGDPAIDKFEDLKSHDVVITSNPPPAPPALPDPPPAPQVPQLPANAGDNQKFKDESATLGFDGTNVFGDIV